MDYLTLSAALLAVIVSSWVLFQHLSQKDAPETAQLPPYDDRETWKQFGVADDRMAGLQGDLQTLSERINAQTLAISEGIDRTERAERRVNAAVQRARQRAADHGFVDDSMEAEAAGLREIDEPVGEPEGVPAVQEDVGPDMTAFPGDWS